MISIGTFFAKDKWWKTGVFFIYCVLLGIAVAKHEPWFDEAQAWLLARDSSFVELMVRYLRYEGSPGLWHVILMIPAKLGLPYIALNITSAVFAAAGAYLFLRYAPFPLGIRLLYPFSFFAFYQYAVVARSYALLPVLLFSIALIYKDKLNRPYLFFGLLILLGNVSFHGLIIASSLVFIHVFEVIRKWRGIKPAVKYTHLASVLLFGLVIFLIKLQLQPPKDLISVAGINKDISSTYGKGMPLLLESLASNGGAKDTMLYTFSVILSSSAIVLSLFWFILRRKLLLFVLPVLSLFIFFTVVYAHAWHMGILFFVWLFVLWVSYQDLPERSDRLTRLTKPVITFTVIAVLLIQACWSYASFKYDYFKNYSASREVAGYFKAKHLENKRIYAINFHSISILPYFSSNIFINYNNKTQPSFWIWSHENSMYREPYLSPGKYNPDIILLGIKNYAPDENSIDKPFLPDIPGYRLSKFFPGALYWKNQPLETDSFALYEK